MITETVNKPVSLTEYLDTMLDNVTKDYNINTEIMKEKVKKYLSRKSNATIEDVNKQSILYALNAIDMGSPDWTFVASSFLSEELYTKAASNRGYNKNKKYGSFYKLINILTEKGIYADFLLNKYSKEEIEELGKAIEPSRDKKLNYIGLFLLEDRYIAKDHDGNVYELPQERFMIIAMTVMQKESKETRLEHVKELYWALSNLYATVATPTLTNSGKSHGQLSSCFIDIIDDSLDGIYLNNWDTARLSKDGGGVGNYYGKVRALGSDIKKFKGNSSGVIPWIKLINDTAVSVDQLGQRQGAIAVYLDVFHKDIMAGFLDLRTNNGDDRRKAHDVFTGVCIPNLFMEKLEEVDENGKSVGQWSTFCPHEVKQIMGWKDKHGNLLGLEDFYDEVDEKYFTEKYNEAVNHPLLPRKTYRAMDIMSRIMVVQLQTGTPYMFYRDTVNQENPNKHVRGRGYTSIYSSNLCTEIMQNMSPTIIVNEYENEQGNIVIERKPGEFVVCNLASINLVPAKRDNVVERVIKIIVRQLDNVIDNNSINVKQAEITNKNYRPIGLGTFGWHHLLAVEGIHWETDEAVEFADKLYGEIAYFTIKASNELAKEKGTYKLFEGSTWSTGEYFDNKGYGTPEWFELKESVKQHGIRNGWLMAVAPNSSTAKIGGGTDGIDPIYNVEYTEEKKNFKFKVTPPDLNHKTYEFYRKSRNSLDQNWSIKQNAARQKHIDQAISFNIYVHHTIKAKELLQLHMNAWKSRLKTTYYIKSTSQKEIKECDSCHS